MKKHFHIILFLFLSFTGFSQNVFFNEVNYLPTTDQWLEIAGPTGTDLSGWEVVIYDNAGVAQDTVELNESIPTGQGCNGIVVVDGSVLLTAPGSGMALVNDVPAVVQYISYGGETTATDGPAIGLTSEDIGTQTIDNFSLQLGGTGLVYNDFGWQLPLLSTKGLVNTNQTFLECNLGLLPVELVEFSGKAIGKNIELQWHTASEHHHSHFNIMHSSDGAEFTRIGTIENATYESAVLKRYEFAFEQPSLGGNYFRLDQVDNDGSVHPSHIIYIEFNGFDQQISVYPNPAQERIRVVLNETFVTENVTVNIIDGQGKIVWQRQMNADNLRSINISDLESGIYFLRVQSNTSQWQTIFVKQQY